MSRTSAGTRSWVRAGASAVIVGLVISVTALPAAAGAPPTISGFSPTSGPVGTSVIISGTDFAGASQVQFNGHSVTSILVNGTGTQITVSVPSGATDGPIFVATPGGSDTSSASFDVTTTTTGSLPQVNGLSPDSGAVGATVHVYGHFFGGATAVRFNGTAVSSFTIVNTGNIQTTVPSGATTGHVSVTTPAGTGTSSINFTVTGTSGLTISSFSPTSGGAGTAVTINGTGFTSVSAVRFNGTGATFSVASTTRINTTVPASATTGRISVTTSAGTVTSSGTFTITGGPKITSVSPTSGSVGTSVAIYGSSFTGVTSVRFNGVSATFSFVSATQVSATVPGGATTGRVTLTTPSGTATSPANFTVIAGSHERSVSLSISGRATRAQLFASGGVSVNDGYTGCLSHVPVVIKRFHRGGWRWVTTTSTGLNGGFRTPIANKAGRYRAKALKITLVNGAICGGKLSNVVRHHR